MKKKDFEYYLKQQGCKLKRQGSKHEIWENKSGEFWSTVPRHKELKNQLCAKICKDLNIQIIRF